METWERISRQRVNYIIDSYQLSGDDDEDFDEYLEDLLQAYPSPQIELALVEILVISWHTMPLIRGLAFLKRSHELLKTWENHPAIPHVSSIHFHLITGLDPTPVFGNQSAQTNRSMFSTIKR